MSRIVFSIEHKFPWHDSHSGYVQLFSNIERHLRAEGSAMLRICMTQSNPQSWLSRLMFLDPDTATLRPSLRNLAKFLKVSPLYSGMSAYHAERYCQRHATTLKPEIIHIAYVEHNFGLLQRNRPDQALLCGSIHQPVSWWQEIYPDLSCFDALDVLFVFSQSEADLLQSLLPGKEVYFVPHGIDADFFRPSDQRDFHATTLQVVFVGRWLRDFESLHSIIEATRDSGIHFNLVLPPSTRAQRGMFYAPHVRLLSNLTSAQLQDLYGKAHVLLLPFHDCVASNTLLEGMASGLAVVSSNLPTIRAYTHPSFASLHEPGDVNGAIQALLHWRDNRSALQQASLFGRAWTQRSFAWDIIARQYLSIYDSLGARSSVASAG